IINAPTDDKPYNHMYTIEMLGNVLGEREVRHLNVDMNTFRQVAIKQLESGESVWFGCDVGQESDRKKGIMDTELYHKDELYDVDFSRSEEHTSELQSRFDLVCRLLLEKKKRII